MCKNIALLCLLLISQPSFSNEFWSSHFFSLELSERQTHKIYSSCLGDIETAAYCSGLLAIHRFFLLNASYWHGRIFKQSETFPRLFSNGPKSYLNSHEDYFVKNLLSNQHFNNKDVSAEALTKLGNAILDNYTHLKNLNMAWKVQNEKNGTYQLKSEEYSNSVDVIEAIKDRLDAHQLVIAAQKLPLVDNRLKAHNPVRLTANHLPFIIIYGYKDLSLHKSTYKEPGIIFNYLSTSYNPHSKNQSFRHFSTFYRGTTEEQDLIKAMDLGYAFRGENKLFKIISFDKSTLDDVEALPEISILRNEFENSTVENESANKKKEEAETKIAIKQNDNLTKKPIDQNHIKKSADLILKTFLAKHDEYLENFFKEPIDLNQYSLKSFEKSIGLSETIYGLNSEDNIKYSLDYFSSRLNNFFEDDNIFPLHKKFIEYEKKLSFANEYLCLISRSFKLAEALEEIKKLLSSHQPIIAIRHNPRTNKKEYIFITNYYLAKRINISGQQRTGEYFSYINGRDGRLYEHQAMQLLGQLKEKTITIVTWNRELPPYYERDVSSNDCSNDFLSSAVVTSDKDEVEVEDANDEVEVEDANDEVEVEDESEINYSPFEETHNPVWKFVSLAKSKLSGIVNWLLSWIPVRGAV